MTRIGKTLSLLVCALLGAPSLAQGPGSCGFHLDIRANGTSTHSSVADMPGGPGNTIGMPFGVPGNPYTAFATPGTDIVLVISGNPLAFGPAPLGPGSCATLFYALGPPPLVPAPVGPPFIGTCGGGPVIAGILGPPLAAVVDSCGYLGPPPFIGIWDTGLTAGRMTYSAALPPFAPPVITFQVALTVPGGAIAVTNAVNLAIGPIGPGEAPVPPPVACGGFAPTDEGQSVGLPVPPAFTFYGFPVPAVDMDTNGFLDFIPGVGAAIAGGCDFTGAMGDLGCAAATPQARPRIDANHADYNFGVVTAAPWAPAMTMEFRPPMPPFWPEAWIYRWKNAPQFGSWAGISGLDTSAFCVELQGPTWAGPPSRIAVVRSWIAGTGLTVRDQCGIGPGVAGQGFGGPPPAALPSTCGAGAAGIAFMGTFAPPAGIPYLGGPFGAIHFDPNAAPTPFPASLAVANSACVFTPIAGGPGTYLLTVY